MKLTVYPSGKGDCLLLESGGKRILIDGGVGESFREEVLPDLAKSAEKPLDCVYLSHIDDDHIGGLLTLVDAIYAWRVFDFRSKKDKKAPKPKMPRPPEVLKVWHNSFSDQLKDNAGPVAAALAETATILSGLDGGDEIAEKVRTYHADLAESTKQSLQLRYRVGAGQLGISVNPEYKGKLMYVRKGGGKLKVGDASMVVIGPFEDDLVKLREDWITWLREKKDVVNSVRTRAKADSGGLTASAGDFLRPLEEQAQELAEKITIPALSDEELKKMGKRSRVTPPNLASLMFFVNEGKTTLLLTGDGHAREVLKGLEGAKKLKPNGGLHVNVLKVQHHGAEYNMTPEFAQRITADHYIFCGNGFQTNPELSVMKTLARSRFGDPEERSANPQTNRRFTFWFNSTPQSAQFAAHMTQVKKLAGTLAAASEGQLTCKFFDRKFEVPL
ncbi:MAG: MBL fold metallo-hydrolase [Acidobacteriota bacterium]